MASGVQSRGIKQAFTKEQVQLIRASLEAKVSSSAGQDNWAAKASARELALFETALVTMLRGNDVLSLKVSDVRGEQGILPRIFVKQRKTSKTVQCLLKEGARTAIERWISVGCLGPEARLFHFTLQYYGRLVKRWARLCHLDPRHYSTHSMRRTYPTYLYKQTGNFMACQHLLGHSRESDSSTYLGIDKEKSFVMTEEYEV